MEIAKSRVFGELEIASIDYFLKNGLFVLLWDNLEQDLAGVINMACIQHTHEDMKGKTWCGDNTVGFTWLFQDIDHAIYSKQQGSFVEVCENCAKEIAKVLNNITEK